MKFSDILQTLLKEHETTAYKLSQSLNVSQSIISHWKNGTKMPSAQNLQRLADYFGVSVDYLLTGEERESESSKELEEETEEQAIDRQLEGHRYALQSLDPDATGDLTLGEKKDVLKFINFLKSQRKFSDQQEEGKSGDKP
ncbi:MAG: helix-turn-helix transcriptional regulator [Ethanoligenens sp.]